MQRPSRRVPLSLRTLVLHVVGCLALLSGESFRAPEPTVEFAPSVICCPTPIPSPALVTGP